MAIGLKLETLGLKKIQRKIDMANRAGRSAIAGAILIEANRTARDARRRTPFKTGALRRSIYVVRPRIGNATTEIGYSAPYAIFVHERTELRHSVGQAKFLEVAVNASRNGFVKRIGRDTSRLMKSGAGIGAVSSEFPTRPPPITTNRT